ncbi:hypothetical protein QE152_g22488 [Popillia japonica]|uniref:Endonuclease-reverse transcriptase n=1 Tax=Popillia japonica TaxID=7064 RepID=A0AAW1KK59_POPJA
MYGTRGQEKEAKRQKRNKPVHNSPTEEEEIAFQTSKVVSRTPSKTTPVFERSENMDEIKSMLLDMKQEIKGELAETRKEIREEIKKISRDVNEIRSGLQQKVNGETRRNGGKTRKKERAKIRNNLVISGIDINPNNTELLKQSVMAMLDKELGLKIKIDKAHQIGPKKCVIHVNEWPEKIAILTEKRRLKGKAIYIESELTREESAILTRENNKCNFNGEKETERKGNLHRIRINKRRKR